MWGSSFRFQDQSAEKLRHCVREISRRNRNQAEKLKETLNAGGRWACVELGMPVANDRARLGNRRWVPDSDQDDCCRHYRDRRSRVHRDAQRAMVGILVQRVYVRHLDHGQYCQQGQTQKCGCPENAWLPAANPAKI
jgi:hypothetical protein